MRYKNRFKAKVVGAIQAGMSPSEASTKFKITPKTVRAWTGAAPTVTRGRTVRRPGVLSRPKLDRVRDAIATLTEAGLL